MIKSIILFCLVLFFSFSVKAQGNTVVNISNFQSNKGICIVCLYDNANAYAGKGNPVKCLRVSVNNKSAEAVFNEVPAGTYAVSVIHDENTNNKFDKNFLGIPTEGYGASQNKLPFAAAPKFEDNKFIHSANATSTVRIKLRYLF